MRRGQRGVVLMSALILVALAAIVATSLFFDTALTARRAAASFSMEQALSLDQNYTVNLAPVKEVSGNFNHIETVSFDGVAPIALAPHEQDNDTGSDIDVPKPSKVEKQKPVQANIKHDADEEGSRAINNKQRPPRRAGLFQAPAPAASPEPEKRPGLLKRLFGR